MITFTSSGIDFILLSSAQGLSFIVATFFFLGTSVVNSFSYWFSLCTDWLSGQKSI